MAESATAGGCLWLSITGIDYQFYDAYRGTRGDSHIPVLAIRGKIV